MAMKRSGGSLVGPYDTNDEEMHGHNDPSAKMKGGVEKGTLSGPYETSKEEAGGHGDGRDAKGNDKKGGLGYLKKS